MEDNSFVKAYVRCDPFKEFKYARYKDVYEDVKRYWIKLEHVPLFWAYIDFANSVQCIYRKDFSDICKALDKRYLWMKKQYIVDMSETVWRDFLRGVEYVNLCGEYSRDDRNAFKGVINLLIKSGWGEEVKLYWQRVPKRVFHEYSSIYNLVDYLFDEIMYKKCLPYHEVPFEVSIKNEYGDGSPELEAHYARVNEFRQLFIRAYPQWAEIFESSNFSRANTNDKSRS